MNLELQAMLLVAYIVAGIVIFALIISIAVLLSVIWLRRRQLKKSSYLIASTSEDDDGQYTYQCSTHTIKFNYFYLVSNVDYIMIAIS